MRKLRKTLIITGVVLVIGIIAAWLTLDYLAKRGVEIGSSYVLGVETRLRGVSIKVLSSTVAIRGLEVCNPAGYQTDHVMALDYGSVKCSLPSLLSKEIVIDEMILDAPEVTVEMRGFPPKTNIGELLDKINAHKLTPEERKNQAHYKVGRICITRTKVRFHTGGGKTADAVLPDIELRDIKNSDGTPVVLADVVGQIVQSIGKAVLGGARRTVPDDLRTGIGNAAKDAAGAVEKGVKGIGDVFRKKK